MSPLPFTVGCSVPLTPPTLDKLKSTFQTVHYHPKGSDDASFSSDELKEIQLFFTTGRGLPESIESLDQLPNLKHIQLASAGADAMLRSSTIKKYIEQQGQGVSLSTASGTHVLSIPPYAVGMTIALLHQWPRIILGGKEKQKWLSEEECDAKGETYYARSTYGRTAGLLGYGALGRETARLLKSHGMRIIAANTSGKATPQDGYVIPGTGDKDGSIPEEYYSTKDPKSVETFLKQSDVLICSLPNTPATHYFLNKEKLELLPEGAVLVNVGRGSLIPSDDLLAILDSPKFFGAAIDVTDPEPLPANHPLWSHPKLIITPHISGNSENEMDIAADVLITNAKRLNGGEGVINEIHFGRGY
ncbi:oxidoreductase [Kwoniella mangroviensis CBS 8886]|nr:oxidoreductase [Kwoniella mangroviensis CBS 8886]